MPVYTNQAAMTYMPPWLKGGNQVATLVLQASAASARLPPVAKSTRSAVRWLASISKKPLLRKGGSHKQDKGGERERERESNSWPAGVAIAASQGAHHENSSCTQHEPASVFVLLA